MDYSTYVPRRLSHPGCVVAGTKLATHYAALKAELKELKVKLSPKVDAAVLAVGEKTQALEQLPSGDATMTDTDRGADRCLAGFHDQLDAIERCFDHASILPLTDEESARLADVVLVRVAALPDGTGFIKGVYSKQWTRMSSMMVALDSDEVAAAVKRLGLAAEVARLRRWTNLYGDKLGVTERKQADPAVAAIEAWHDAYGELFAHVLSEYNDRTDGVHAKIREALTSPYESMADEERRADAKARAKRKGAPKEG